MCLCRTLGVRGFVGVLEGGLGGCCLGEFSRSLSRGLGVKLTKNIGLLLISRLLGMPCRRLEYNVFGRLD